MFMSMLDKVVFYTHRYQRIYSQVEVPVMGSNKIEIMLLIEIDPYLYTQFK